MKIRTGFVSNSSSSSFVLTTTEEHWENVKKEIEPFQVAVAEFIMKEDTFLGHDIVSFSTWDSHSVGWSDTVDYKLENDYKGPPSEEGYDADSAWSDIKRRLMKKPELVSANGDDW